jgi:hypothetical protein
MCSHYDIGDVHRAAWSCREADTDIGRISDLVWFEPDIVSVQLEGIQLRLEPGQAVIPHGSASARRFLVTKNHDGATVVG